MLCYALAMKRMSVAVELPPRKPAVRLREIGSLGGCE